MPNVLVRELGASIPTLLESFVEHVGLALGSVAVVVLTSVDFKRLFNVQQVQPFHQIKRQCDCRSWLWIEALLLQR